MRDPDNIKNIYKLNLSDRILKFQEIADNIAWESPNVVGMIVSTMLMNNIDFAKTIGFTG